VTFLVNNQTMSSRALSQRLVLLMVLTVSLSVSLGLWGAQSAHAAFGFLPGAAGFDGSFTNQDGSTDVQAGSHPYAFTTSIHLNRVFKEGLTDPDGGDLKDVTVDLPAGFIGYPNATSKCTPEQLSHSSFPQSPAVACPTSSQIGVALVDLTESLGGIDGAYESVFNMVAPAGKPAVLGFAVLGVSIFIDTKIRTGSDYRLSSSLHDIPGAFPTLGTTLTLWGVPGDPSHDKQRCVNLEESKDGNCDGLGYFYAEPHEFDLPRRPFLTLPTSCAGPQTVQVSADSWQEPGVFVQDSFITHNGLGEQVGFEGCNRLGFTPTITSQPDTGVAATPSGLHFDLHLPQNDAPEALSEAELKGAVVTLPAGVTVNPSSANGLGVCSPAQIDLSGSEPAGCPESSKVGTVEAITPVLDHPVKGFVYLAEQGNNPFGSLIALYIALSDPQTGTVVKVAARVELDPQTGQLRTVLDNSPQLPFEDLKLDFFGGPRAPLVTPASCGVFTTASDLTPWSSPYANDATPSNSFAITSGVGGAGCGNGFAPSFSAGTVNNQGGAFSAFSTTFVRSDQEQNLAGVTVTTPPGLLAILKGVERCPEPQASQGTCGAGSLIGHTTAVAGAGPTPVSVGGQVFLTGPYKGAPFGLSIVVPAVAGPFNLGIVVVRAAIHVDPHTAQITVLSDPLPTILQGVPLLVKKVNVSIDRPGFMFNPTSCEPLMVGGTLTSAQGASMQVSDHFQAANCAALAFKPSFTVSTQAKTSKKNGASLDVRVGYPKGSQANIRSVAVTLPKALPSRLTTIQQACPEGVFNANPASCPAGSNIGFATASTPVLANPVTGPAYLVSHGGAAFPDLVLILQGEGVTLELIGSIDIKHGVTSSAFASVPDAPISSFELKLPEGPHSGLAAVVPAKAKGNLCGQNLTMPTILTGQNGMQIKQTTKIQVTGCPKAKKKAKKAKKHKKKGKAHKQGGRS
jgi:hypothetical protein